MRKRAFTLLELVISVAIAALVLVGVGMRVQTFVKNRRFQKSVDTVKMRLDMASKLARMSRNIAQVDIAENEGEWTIAFGLVCLPQESDKMLPVLQPKERLEGVREITFSDDGKKEICIEFDASEAKVPGQTLTIFQKGGDGEEQILVDDYVGEVESDGNRGFPNEALSTG